MRAFILTLAAILSVSALSFAQETKIGYVKVNVLLHSFSEFTDASVTLKNEVQGWQTQLENYQKQLAGMQDNYRQKEMLSSPDKQREMQAEIVKKNQEAVKFKQDIFGPEGKAEKRKNELMAPINDKVNQAINIVGARDKYTLIFNEQGLLYAGSGTDVTAEVLKVLKAGLPAAPAAAPKPAAKPVGADGPRK